MKKQFSEEQIIGFLKEADQGLPVKELCRKRGLSEASFYLWRSKYGGMNVSDAKRLKALEVRIPRHVGPRFHVMPGQDSTACRTTVPRQAGPAEG